MISISYSRNIVGNEHARFYERVEGELLDLAEIAKTSIWSPIVWRGGWRRKADFKECHYVALDFDNGLMPLKNAQAFAIEEGYSHILGTTKNHQKEKISASGVVSPACDRFRLVFRASSPVTDRVTYEHNMKLTMKKFPCDRSCSDAARFFYPCTEIVSVAIGKEWDWVPLPKNFLPEKAFQQRQNASLKDAFGGGKLLPRWATQALAFGAPEGQRHVTCYRLGATLSVLSKTENEIVSLVMSSPLAAIGEADVRRAVANGIRRALGEVSR